jgi:hypothetical protein
MTSNDASPTYVGTFANHLGEATHPLRRRPDADDRRGLSVIVCATRSGLFLHTHILLAFSAAATHLLAVRVREGRNRVPAYNPDTEFVHGRKR